MEFTKNLLIVSSLVLMNSGVVRSADYNDVQNNNSTEAFYNQGAKKKISIKEFDKQFRQNMFKTNHGTNKKTSLKEYESKIKQDVLRGKYDNCINEEDCNEFGNNAKKKLSFEEVKQNINDNIFNKQISNEERKQYEEEINKIISDNEEEEKTTEFNSYYYPGQYSRNYKDVKDIDFLNKNIYDASKHGYSSSNNRYDASESGYSFKSNIYS